MLNIPMELKDGPEYTIEVLVSIQMEYNGGITWEKI